MSVIELAVEKLSATNNKQTDEYNFINICDSKFRAILVF